MIKLLRVCYSLRPRRCSVMMCGGLRAQATLQSSALWRGRGLEQHLRRMLGVGWQPGRINQIIFSFFIVYYTFKSSIFAASRWNTSDFPPDCGELQETQQPEPQSCKHKGSGGRAGGVRWEHTVGKPNLTEQNESHLRCVSLQLLENTHLGMCNSSFQ